MIEELGFQVLMAILVIGAFLFIAIIMLFKLFYKKAITGQALIRTGFGGTKVTYDGGIIVVPVVHKLEIMDISVRKIEIDRLTVNGLICKDNMRADIKVVFFVRVNKEQADIRKVADTIGCARAADTETLVNLFEAKFSEALKTVGKRFDFSELYESRREFRDEIIEVIGTDLNGYSLEDCAIDYLEQTSLEHLKDDNILDVEGKKKIIDLTAKQKVKANLIQRDEEKIIKQQDVEAREAILELEKQLAEKEEKQRREIANIRAREGAETNKVAYEEKLKAEKARVSQEEEVQVAEENKDRQIIIARKNKERTEAVETERVEKDRMLEVTERERIVTLAEIEKEKAIEIEKKDIQDVIKERVMVEKSVVEEEEKIKDLRAFKEADRQKQVAIVDAEKVAQSNLVEKVKEAEAAKDASELYAKQLLIEADARKEASVKDGEARKTLADAEAAEYAAMGLSEAQVMEAKAQAKEREGEVEAYIIEKTAFAEAKGIEAKAEAEKKRGAAEADVIAAQGEAEAKVIEMKGVSEAKGITDKAEAMKKLDGVGKDHEEFKLKLDKEKAIDLARINIQKDIAEAQAEVIGEALKAANIDIVGGETMFFDQIIGSITKGKSVDRIIDNSETLSQVREALIPIDGTGDFQTNMREMIDKFGVSSEDIKNLSIAALIAKMAGRSNDESERGLLGSLMNMAKSLGFDNKRVGDINL